MNNSYYIETFGCQMNKSDSELMGRMLEEAGYSRTETHDKAGVVIFNTCSVRKNAEERAVARLREASAHSKHKDKGIVIATGCLSQHIGEQLLKDGVCDIVIGPYQSPGIASIIESYRKDTSKNIFLSVKREEFNSRLHPHLSAPDERDFWHKWVTITHGCENFCTYCIVPFVRGPLISFPSESILDYISLLVKQGVIEITLLGQNVNQYGQDCNEIPFYRLLEKTAHIEGLKKINFLTSHPKDFSKELIEVIRDNDIISNAIHLPLQSGSDEILKRMNRGYSMKHYMNIVEMIQSNLDDYTLSTDLIVGFPGENDEHFNETMKAVSDIRFDEAFMYAYSPREGTKSAEYSNQVDLEIRKKRLSELINLQRIITVENMSQDVGKNEIMVPERLSKKNSSELSGKTHKNRSIVIPGSADDIGKVIQVHIEKVNGATLYGSKI